MGEQIPAIFLFGVKVNTETEDEVLEFIVKGLQNSKKKGYIVTLNPEIIVHANNDRRFRDVLNNARLGLPDGMGVIWC